MFIIQNLRQSARFTASTSTDSSDIPGSIVRSRQTDRCRAFPHYEKNLWDLFPAGSSKAEESLVATPGIATDLVVACPIEHFPRPGALVRQFAERAR